MLIHDIHKTPELPDLNEPLIKLVGEVSPNKGKSLAQLHARTNKLSLPSKQNRDHLLASPIEVSQRYRRKRKARNGLMSPVQIQSQQFFSNLTSDEQEISNSQKNKVWLSFLLCRFQRRSS